MNLILSFDHTPGPWFVKESVVTQQLMIRGDGGNVCGVYLTSKGERMPQQGNARLIAAAPELLEACKQALDALKHEDTIEVDLLRAAIGKAEGQP